MKDWIDIYFMNRPEDKAGMWKKKKKEMIQEAHGKKVWGINKISKNQIAGYIHPRKAQPPQIN